MEDNYIPQKTQMALKLASVNGFGAFICSQHHP
jgi:hypothetical protein